MSLDPLIADLFDYAKRRHAEELYVSSMPAFARALGYEYAEGSLSVTTSTKTILVNAFGTAQERHEEGAHEICHALADEGEYTQAIRHYHSSVPDIEAHLELLTDHTMDLVLMPDPLVEEVVKKCGRTARAVWELSQFSGAGYVSAGRRLTFFDIDFPCGFFMTEDGHVKHVFRNKFKIELKYGDRMPEPAILFEHGATLLSIPGLIPRVLVFLASE